MGQQPIRIETLGDLVAHGYGMNAMCEKWRHREGFIYLGRTLNGRLVCSACGEKTVHCQIHYLHSGRSRFA